MSVLASLGFLLAFFCAALQLAAFAPAARAGTLLKSGVIAAKQLFQGQESSCVNGHCTPEVRASFSLTIIYPPDTNGITYTISTRHLPYMYTVNQWHRGQHVRLEISSSCPQGYLALVNTDRGDKICVHGT